MARHRTVVALSLLAALPLSASALPRPRSTRPSLAAPARLEARQFLCGLLGTCDTTTTAAAAASAAQQTPAADSAVPAASSATATSAAATAPAATSATATEAVSVPQVGATSSSTSAAVPAADTTTSAAPTPTSETSAAATPTSTSTLSTPTSTSTTSTASSTSASSASTIIVTLTSVLTNADGSESTMTHESASAVPVAPKENSSGGGPSGKTWGIIGGVVGGIAVLAALLYVGYRLTQRRFSNLDADGDDIRWPELQPDGGGTLNPQGTRRTGGAGFAMEKDDDESDDEDGDELDRKGAAATGGEWAAAEGSPRIGAGVGAGAGGHYGMGHNASETAFFEGQGGHSPFEQYEGAYGQPHSRGSYYDPYLPHAHSSDPALVPLSHAAAVAGPYAPPLTYPPTYAHYGAPAGRSTESLGQYRATSPRY